MYIPRINEEKRIPVMHTLIRAQSFGTLITLCSTGGTSGLIASHIPMVLEDNGSDCGILKAHVAVANMQWRNFDSSIDALAIFAGPHHYISASWYPGAIDPGTEVPTWNYAVVHAYGPLRAIPGTSQEGKDWLRAHVTSLTDIHEAASQQPWQVSNAPEAYFQAEIAGIVGLELPIRRLEGKWKTSQNRNARDRAAVVEGLRTLDTEASLAMIDLIERSDKG